MTIDSERASDAEVVLLGTGGGPVWWPGSDRVGISSAVRVDNDVYLVDFGDGAGRRLKEAELVPPAQRTPGGFWGMESLRAMFITHLHSDHVVDLPNLLLMGWTNGLRTRTSSDPIAIYGPGPRHDLEGNVVMEPVFERPDMGSCVHVESPDSPVPGTVEMVERLYQAFALDLNDRMRDNRHPSVRTYFDIHDIAIPAQSGYHPNDHASPHGMSPFLVHKDESVTVTATLVDHYPIAPAFAFRFDTQHGSVVFSGDTGGPNDNLIALARGADILVHEVITRKWVDLLLPEPRTGGDEALRNHLLSAHTLPDDAARVAAEAGVSTLVFSHVVPGNAEEIDLMPSREIFGGTVVVGEDLMRLPLGQGDPSPGR